MRARDVADQLLTNVMCVYIVVTSLLSVIARIGSVDFFSRDLLDLEREVAQLKNRNPCPRKYKATSAEHLFHRNQNDFQNDWCSFRLVRV